jgi:hypothetical protein
MRRVTRTIGLLAVVLLASLALAASAWGNAPWWHLISGARPAYLHVGGGEAAKPEVPAVDEVQEVTLGEGGTVIVIVGPKVTEEEINNEEFLGDPSKSVELTNGTTEQEAQEGIQALEGYGAGNVQVHQLDSGHYTVTFVGALGGQPVALMRPGYGGLGAITQVTAGQPAVPSTPATDGEIYLTAENVGDANVDGGGSSVSFRDVLPAGLEAVAMVATKPHTEGDFDKRERIPCSFETLTCTLAGGLAPYDQLEMRISVRLKAGAHSGEMNEVGVSGGGAPSVSIRRPITVSSDPVPFAVESYEMGLEEEGGTPSTQAGSHPFQLTTTLTFNQLRDINPLPGSESSGFKPEVTAPALAKDLQFKLPPGLIGNPTPIAQCTTEEFFHVNPFGGAEQNDNACPPQSAVGVAVVTLHEPAILGTATFTEPVFNLEPRVGEPARFGFYVTEGNSPVFIDTAVRTGGDYGVTVSVSNVTQTVSFLSSEVTFWGVPGDPRHDGQRGWSCLHEAREVSHLPCLPSGAQHPKPFLTLPTQCSSPMGTSVKGDSWAEPTNVFQFTGLFSPAAAPIGCNHLQFAPEVKVAPDGQEASKPTGLTVDVHVPQEVNENAEGLASSNVKAITVRFPQGVVLNPAAADGLQACDESQIGLLGGLGEQGEFLFTATLGEAFCPDAAKVGTVSIKSPLLPKGQNVEGALYLARPAPNHEPGKNPFNSLLATYIVARDPVSGTLVKLPGSVSLDEATGQITATFENNPQLAFEDAEIHLFGGERAPFATPSHCGTYTTTATFTPWSGTGPVSSSSSFQITSGPGGTPCPPAVLPFNPTLTGGSTNVSAGSFSPLSTTISRDDGNQDIKQVQLHFPNGLSGLLKGVALCPEAQANAGTCGAESLIGHTIVSVGLGSDPFSVTGGRVYLTEKYRGAPFGLSIVNPAVAGPFDLGVVVVRAKIEVDQHTAALTVTTDEPSSGFSIPTMLKGIPLQIKHVNVLIDRPGFTFNPTNCNPQTITGTIQSAESAQAPVSTAFQATNCTSLKFTPKFSVSTGAHTSKANGASLTAKLSEPNEPFGSQANISKVKVELPKQLPSRLTTLQKACTNAQFETNPAGCPAASNIGHARVTTPLLPVPLEGPAIFVSHGGEAFPSLTMVLQGYGVTVDLVGTTFISKAGVTSTTFKTVPDVPFNTFELTLPTGKYSALTALGRVCNEKLTMPTEFTAQNGMTLHQNTNIAVTGCSKKKVLTRAQKLALALRTCHKQHNRAERTACERAARKKYGPLKKSKKT